MLVRVVFMARVMLIRMSFLLRVVFPKLVFPAVRTDKELFRRRLVATRENESPRDQAGRFALVFFF